MPANGDPSSAEKEPGAALATQLAPRGTAELTKSARQLLVHPKMQPPEDSAPRLDSRGQRAFAADKTASRFGATILAVPLDLSRIAAGTTVPGTKWVVCGVLGEGGMGMVLEVVKEPGIRGAMKIIRPDIGGRPDFVARFLHEVRILASLEHRNIVRVFDFDRIDGETPFLVMELLVGGTLRQAIRAHGRAIPAPMAYEIMRQACDGLDRAHSATPSIVHRDLKPENIFLHGPRGDQPLVKVMDFGLATLADGVRDHGLFGTPRYMAPEQLRGERVTVRSDIYAAALVLYEMLTGRFPWDLTAVRVEDAHLLLPPEPASKFAPWLPPSVDAHILAALAKNPSERPHDAFAFMAKLYELQWAEGTSSPIGVHTTAPTLATLADVLREPKAGGDVDSQVTFRGMTPPPMEGRTLELAPSGFVPGETEKIGPPRFSAETMARAALGMTKVPSGVDRNASTRAYVPITKRMPKHDTEPLPAIEEPPLVPAAPSHPSSNCLPAVRTNAHSLASDPAVARSIHSRRSTAPPTFFRRHVVEVVAFVGTVAIAAPAAVLVSGGRPAARAADTSVQPPVAMNDPAAAAAVSSVLVVQAGPLPSLDASLARAPTGSAEFPDSSTSIPPNLPEGVRASAAQHRTVKPKPPSGAHVLDVMGEFLPWPDHP